jgi:hypothetical protein
MSTAFSVCVLGILACMGSGCIVFRCLVIVIFVLEYSGYYILFSSLLFSGLLFSGLLFSGGSFCYGYSVVFFSVLI